MFRYPNLRKNETGVYLGGSIGLTRPEAYHYRGERHILLYGPNASGKDSSIITPNLAELKRSVFVIDPKGEQAAITARARSRFSRVLVINPFDLLVETHPHLKSCRFNPLRSINVKLKTFVDDCVELARALVKVDPIDPQKHFAESARALVAALIMWEILTRGNEATLGHVRTMLCEPLGVDDKDKPIGLSKTVADILAWAERDPIAQPASNKIGELLHKTNEIKSIRNSARTATDFLDSPPIADDLAKDGCDFAAMKSELLSVYLILPATRLGEHGTWLRVAITSALQALMRTAINPAMPRPLLILNEVGQLGHLEPLVNAMGIARGFGVQIMTVWQSLNQMRTHYEKSMDTFIGARGALVSFAAQDWETAEYFSKLCGHSTEIVTSRSLKPGDPVGTTSEGPQSYPLMRPEDIMRLERGETLNFVEPVRYPFLGYAPPYWETPFADGLDPNPYHPGSSAGTSTLATPPIGAGTARSRLDELIRARKKDMV
jgi:type IV secretion system protein VirD4